MAIIQRARHKSTLVLSRPAPRLWLTLVTVLVFFTAGCGGQPQANCGNIIGINVFPSISSLGHLPGDGNSQIFTSVQRLQGGPGCPDITPASIDANWDTNSSAVQISPASGTSTTATCVATNPGLVMVRATATLPSGKIFTSQASIFCK